MSTATLPPPTPSVPVEEFAYGWRDIEWTAATGEHMRQRVPLTLEDILHPEVGDFRMHSDKHERICTYLFDVSEAQTKHDPQAIVMHDVRTQMQDPTLKPLGPDVAIVFNVREHKNWSTFDSIEEGTQPTVIFEVTSPKTRSVDLVNKVDEYGQAGIPYYIIIDTQKRGGEEILRLLGYEMSAHGYAVMVPNNKDRLWIEPLKMFVGIENNEVICYDAEGEPIADYVGLTDERDAERERADAAEELAASEQERAEAAKRIALAEKKRADDAARLAEAEKRRAEEAARLAEAEKQRADSAESRLAQLEAELERLRAKRE